MDSTLRPRKELMYFQSTRKKLNSSKLKELWTNFINTYMWVDSRKIDFCAMYEFLNKNNLLTPKQSGFRPGDSTMNQLLSVTNKIHKAFNEYTSRETRAMFLNISKAFDKVWHEGLIFKLKSNGFSGNFLISSKAFYLSAIKELS